MAVSSRADKPAVFEAWQGLLRRAGFERAMAPLQPGTQKLQREHFAKLSVLLCHCRYMSLLSSPPITTRRIHHGEFIQHVLS